jgi:GxxExxY protein
MLYENITEKILEATFEVSNELGSGFLESVYKKSLIMALQQKGLKAEEQVELGVHFRRERVGIFYADIVVEDSVIIEL